MKQFLTITFASLLFWLPLNAQSPAWFSDVSTSVGFDSTAPALRLNVRDINGDQYPDVFTIENVNQRDMIHVYLNVQDSSSTDPTDRTFVEWTDSSGVNLHQASPDSTRRAEILCLADIDNDGDPDLITGTWHWDPDSAAINFPWDRPAVMLNDGQGHFSHVMNHGFDGLGMISIAGLSYFDYNQDGFLDIYVSTFSDDHPNTQFRHDYIMIGNGDGTFSIRPGFFDINTVVFPNYGCSSTDWNNDGWADIMTSPYCRDAGALWKNLGGNAFQDVSFAANYDAQQMQGDNGQELCQWGVYPCDFDNDGDMDIFQALVHGGLDSAEGRSTIAVNTGPTNNYRFEWELDRLSRANPQSTHLGNMDAAWIDIDFDMLADLVVTETEYHVNDRMYVYMQDSTHYFNDETVTMALHSYRSHAIEAVDFDLDGDYDLIMNDRDNNTRLVVLENEIGNQNNWVGIVLDPPASVNQDAIGARITVVAGGVTQIREVQAGTGHFAGQNPLRKMFGLAQNTNIDYINVAWPGQFADQTIVYNPPINQVITIDSTFIVHTDDFSPQSLNLYPNPSTGKTMLQGWDFAKGDIEVRVFDILGKEMKVGKKIEGLQVEMNMEALSPGVYLIEVFDQANKIQETKRLLLK